MVSEGCLNGVWKVPGGCLMGVWRVSIGCPNADIEKGADTRTLSVETFEIVEDYAPLFSEENLFLVKMFGETFNIWHIYSL